MDQHCASAERHRHSVAAHSVLQYNYCQAQKRAYKTEHDRLVGYLQELDLTAYVGVYDPQDVVVLTDSSVLVGWHLCG